MVVRAAVYRAGKRRARFRSERDRLRVHIQHRHDIVRALILHLCGRGLGAADG